MNSKKKSNKPNKGGSTRRPPPRRESLPGYTRSKESRKDGKYPRASAKPINTDVKYGSVTITERPEKAEVIDPKKRPPSF